MVSEGRTTHVRSLSRCWFLILGGLLGATPYAASADDPVAIEYDHLGMNRNVTLKAELKAGQRFVVRITNTMPSAFNYNLAAATPAEITPRAAAAALGTVELPEIYDPSFSAYVLTITRKPGQEVVTHDGKALNEVVVIIDVSQVTWNLEFSGAFVGNTVTDPVFSVGMGSNDEEVIVREEDKEDVARLGIAAMIHLYHRKLPWLAGSFGLGVESSGSASYYLGPSIRLGDKAAITGGAVWMPTKRLPAGATVGDRPPNENTLSNLSTQLERGWFVGISYTFLGSKDRFKKPFKLPEDEK